MGGAGGRTGATTLQTALSSPDDEWAVLAPKIQRVTDVQTQLSSTVNAPGAGFGGGARAGFTGTAAAVPVAAGANVQSALAELNRVLQDPSQGDEVVRAKLQAYRDAVKATQEALKTAREDLKTYVTLRQEAILMGLGYLD
jgi:hypothetical protein